MPTRPPPPEPYETWIDWILCDYCDFTCTDSRNKVETAKAELAELRAGYAASHAVTSGCDQLHPPEACALFNPEIYAMIAVFKREGVEFKDMADVRRKVDIMLAAIRPTPDPADEYLRTARTGQQ